MKYKRTWILTGISIGGLFATVVASVKNTRKHINIVEEEKPETTEEKIKAFLRSYWQTMVISAATGACILANQKVNMKHLAFLTSAVGVISGQYKKYQQKIVEEIGPEREAEIRAELAKEDWIAWGGGLGGPYVLPHNDNPENVLFHDGYLDKWFWASVDRVKDAMYYTNRDFQIGQCVGLLDFYEFIGVELEEDKKVLGWLADEFWTSGLIPWVEFGAEKSVTDDGQEYWEISYAWEPYNTEEKAKELEEKGIV